MARIWECMEAPKHSHCYPKYATDYIVLKEAVRQVFLGGFGNHLFDIKKAIYPMWRDINEVN